MTVQLTKSIQIKNALNFRRQLSRVDPISDSIYMFIGRDSAWPDDLSPPSQSNTIDSELETRDNMLVLKKVLISNVAFVIRRINWTYGEVYDEYSSSANLINSDFYVLTTGNHVYKCLDNADGQPSAIEPSGTSVVSFQTGDGYTWKYMYTLSNALINDFLTQDWLPVPTDEQRLPEQISVESNASYTTGSPFGGHGSSAIDELFATRIMISQYFSGDESGVIGTPNITFRQFGLIENVKTDGNDIATGTVYFIPDSNNEINVHTGNVLYIENRSPITRNVDQTENIKAILSF